MNVKQIPASAMKMETGAKNLDSASLMLTALQENFAARKTSAKMK